MRTADFESCEVAWRREKWGLMVDSEPGVRLSVGTAVYFSTNICADFDGRWPGYGVRYRSRSDSRLQNHQTASGAIVLTSKASPNHALGSGSLGLSIHRCNDSSIGGKSFTSACQIKR